MGREAWPMLGPCHGEPHGGIISDSGQGKTILLTALLPIFYFLSLWTEDHIFSILWFALSFLFIGDRPRIKYTYEFLAQEVQ
jgi:asparagine N-glycosylation enzyme membrane subunit Stt3